MTTPAQENARPAHADPTPVGLTHVDESGAARMVDVGAKDVTHRVAVAGAFISMQPATLDLIVGGDAPKGDVLAAARIAGIMAAKRTSDLIPMCHPLAITHASVDLAPVFADASGADSSDASASGPATATRTGIAITATVATDGKTGIEMEALTAAAIAGLTIYDMCKAVDRGMVLSNVALLRKEGGKSGTWIRKEDPK